MKIATILPSAHLYLEMSADYHMCLAHRMKTDPIYTAFFKAQVKRGAFVIQDTGVVETGEPLPISELIEIASWTGCQEMILPDIIYNYFKTVEMSLEALLILREAQLRDQHNRVKVMVVPQGDTPGVWMECVRRMLTWEVDTIGITRFLVPRLFPSRTEALKRVPELINSNKDIHILGCPGHPAEMAGIEATFPGRIRGVDSGIAAIYTQEGMLMMNGAKPYKEINLDAVLDDVLLWRNVRTWKEECEQSWKKQGNL